MIGGLGHRLREMGITAYDSLSRWEPRVGDMVIYNGLVKHWFGIVSLVENHSGTVHIVHEILPITVVTMGPKKQEKHTRKYDTIEIRNSRGGKWAVIQSVAGQQPTIYVG